MAHSSPDDRPRRRGLYLILAPLLARAEDAGRRPLRLFRRGGLSGVQYTTEEAAEELARLAGAAASSVPALLSTVDPANLYGSGAPLDIPLLEGGTARLVRTPANLLVLIAGRPVLIIEGYGKRLTGLASASESEIRAALALVPGLAGPSRRVLKVESYNAAPAPASSPAAPWIADLGLRLRDPRTRLLRRLVSFTREIAAIRTTDATRETRSMADTPIRPAPTGIRSYDRLKSSATPPPPGSVAVRQGEAPRVPRMGRDVDRAEPSSTATSSTTSTSPASRGGTSPASARSAATPTATTSA